MIKKNGNEYLRPAYLEIDLKALASNVKKIKRRLGKKIELLAVVKADGYGHGAYEVSKTALRNGAGSFGVAFLEEGIELRENGIKAPILILSPECYVREKKLIEYDLQPVVTDLDFVNDLEKEAKKQNKIAQVYLKMDTGMRRYGIEPSLALAFVKRIQKLKNVKLKGILSQFSTTEDEDRDFAEKQLSIFKKTVKKIEELNGGRLIRSIANSGAFLKLPQSYFDQVRVGILMYGIYPSPKLAKRVEVNPVMSLKSRLVQIKKVEKGESVGYGRTFITKRRTKIGTIPLGYADGYPWQLSNQGEVLVKGKRVPIIGRVCMDAFMVDLTDLPEVKTGEEVVLLGKQGKEKIEAHQIAGWAKSFSYEIVSRMGKRLPRVYLK
ncbi:MAG: alanine racemase [candidate division Zixibacteria bacterium RBG_16_43_9]|nr:MAG: alanine racemase [candidate division Zixibacteria bacterium RBG_16_43_9]